jgi:hypothetical protein
MAEGTIKQAQNTTLADTPFNTPPPQLRSGRVHPDTYICQPKTEAPCQLAVVIQTSEARTVGGLGF